MTGAGIVIGIDPFQFQYGPIVRVASIVGINIDALFQFQYGPIVSFFVSSASILYSHFNSSMVRL